MISLSVLKTLFSVVHSPELRQTRQMRSSLDTACCRVSMSHVRHLPVHVDMSGVLPPRRPLHTRLQHVPVAGWRRMRLWRQIRHEGGWVSYSDNQVLRAS